MSAALQQFRANRQPTDNWLNFWNAIVLSPVGWLWFGWRTAWGFLSMVALIMWDFCISAFSAFLNLVVTLPLSIFFLVFLFSFFALYKWWSPIVNTFKDHVLPVIQDIFNAVRIFWNIFVIVVADIMIQMWNALSPTLLFLLEFVVNYGITMIEKIVELLDDLDLESLFEDLMGLVLPLMQLFIALLKLLVAMGPFLIKVCIPVIITILKLMIYLIYVVVAITIFLFTVLVIAIAPILLPLIAIVFLFAWIVGRGTSSQGFSPNSMSMSRLLLEVATTVLLTPLEEAEAGAEHEPAAETPQPTSSGKEKFTQPEINHATKLFFTHMSSTAASLLSPDKWQSIADNTVDLAQKTLARTVYTTTASGHSVDINDIFPDYDRVLYGHVETTLSEQEVAYGPDPRGRQLLANLKGSLEHYVETLEPEEAIPDKDLELSPFDDPVQAPSHNKSRTKSPPLLKNAGTKAAGKPFNEAEFEAHMKDQAAKQKHQKQQAHKINLREHRKNLTAMIDPAGNDHWLIDHSAHMEPEEVFPGLKKRKYTEIDLTGELLEDKRGMHTHHRRRRATAVAHAFTATFKHMYRRHISSGQLHHAVKNSFQHLTGHSNLPELIKTYRKNYVNARHMLYDLMPDWDDHPWTKSWKESDPAFAEGSWHDTARSMGFADGKFPRWVWEKYEAELQRRDRVMDRRGVSAARIHSEDVMDSHSAGLEGDRILITVPPEHYHKRQLKSDDDPTVIDLSFFYRGKSCSGTGSKHFIFCIPRLPLRSYRIPVIHLADVFQVDQLTNATSSGSYSYQDGNATVTRQLWSNSTCIFCLAMLRNTWTEIRFSIYWLDVLSYVLLFGVFLPYARPTVALGLLGKIFPPAGFFIDKFLLFPIGTMPEVKYFIFYFEYFLPLAAIVTFLYFYKTLIKWATDWLKRSYNAIRGWLSTLNVRNTNRHTLLEAADENLLGLIISSYYTAKEKSNYRAGQRGQMDIEANMYDKSRPPPEYRPAGSEQQPIGDDLASLNRYDDDRASVVRLVELEQTNDELKRHLVTHLDRLEAVLGAGGFNAYTDSVAEERESHKQWHVQMAPFHMPFIIMPSYLEHLRLHQESLPRIKPPPSAHYFSHMVEDGSEVPVFVHTSEPGEEEHR